MAPFRSYEHLVRLAALFALGVALFLGLRSVLVPDDYGRHGPYRAAALAANQARPIIYAGQAACVDCHSDVADIRKTNAHARISCESCHGPLAGHAMDPAVPVIPPNPRAICAVCHLPSASKPPDFKTIDFTDHAGAEACTTCHRAHAPKL